MSTIERPKTGEVEERQSPSAISVEGKRLRGVIPYGVESRDMGGWTEVIEPGALRGAKLDDLVATVDHAGVPVGRYPTTLDLEDRSEALHWSVALPESRSDVREAVERGDLRAGSWRMVVAKDRWEDDVRHVEEIAELRDVSVVTSPAYPSAAVELRSTEPTIAADEPQENEMETETPIDAEERSSAGLEVETIDRVSDRPVEDRFYEEFKTVSIGEVRALSTTSASAIAPAEMSTMLFDKLRPSSIALQSGIRVISTDRESITWPQLTVDPTPAFYSEGGTITPGDPTFTTLTAEPAKIAHIVQCSNEVIDDSDPSIVEVITDNLTKVLGLKLDAAIFSGGTAVPGITGLENTASIQTGGTITSGGEALWDPIISAVGLLQAANVPEPYAIAAPPTVMTALALAKTTGESYEQLAAPRDLPPVYTSTQLSTYTYVYAPAELVLVRRQDATVEVDRSRLFNSDSSEIRGKLRADLLVPNPSAVVRLTTGS